MVTVVHLAKGTAGKTGYLGSGESLPRGMVCSGQLPIMLFCYHIMIDDVDGSTP